MTKTAVTPFPKDAAARILSVLTIDPGKAIQSLETAHEAIHAVLTIHDLFGIDVIPMLVAKALQMIGAGPQLDAEFVADPPSMPAETPEPKKRTMSAAGRRAISKAQKARWAAAGKKAAATRAANKGAR